MSAISRVLTLLALVLTLVSLLRLFWVWLSLGKLSKNKPKMAYSRDAFTRDKRETREKLERYGAMEDGLT